jgi:small-conductance mechanosensitive channel
VSAADPAADTSATSLPPLGTLTPEQANALIARLSDAQVRELLLQQLDRRTPEPGAVAPNTDAVLIIAERAQIVRYRLGEMVAALPDVPYAALFVVDRLTDDRDPRRILEITVGLAVILAAAACGEFAFRWLFGPVGGRVAQMSSSQDFGKLALLAARAFVDFLALAVFAVVGIAVYFVVHPDEHFTRVAFWSAFLALLAVRAVVVVLRALLAPRRPDIRLPLLPDERARRLYRWLVGLCALTGAVHALARLVIPAGLPEPLTIAWWTILQWLLLSALIASVWLKRRDLSALLGSPFGGQVSAGHLAGREHVLFTCALIGLGLFATISRLLTGEAQGSRILPTLVLLVAWPALDGFMRVIVRHLVPPPEGLSVAVAGADASDAALTTSTTATSMETGDYAPVVIRNARVMMAVFGVLVLARIWDVELHDFAPAGLASRIGEASFQIIVTLILASALWGIIKTAISRHAPEEAIDPHALVEGEGTGSGLSRRQTLLPLVRKFLFITLVTIVGMIIVSSLGVDIGPLLAGAGVVGIAIGFGAQALVRDIVSGIFFLIDDAFRVGEYIDVGSAKGMVERISVRSLRLRHHLGQINTVPFGEIKHVTNYSRDWVIMKLELRVPLDTDLEKVRRLVKGVGQQMLKEPELADNLLQPLKSQGVHRMEPSAYVIRVKFMAKPGEQFILRREVFRRLHETFHEHGIRLGVSPVMVDGAQSFASATAAADAVAPYRVPPTRP